jgi:hypothetical protein
MDVGCDLRLRERLQLGVAQGEGFLDLTEDLEVPRREIGLRNGAGVEDGPLLRQVLAGRESGRVEPFVDQLLLRLGPEEGQPTAPGYAEETDYAGELRGPRQLRGSLRGAPRT